MAFAGLSYIAVLIAAVVAWIVGAAWYGVLSKPWMAAAGLTRETANDPATKRMSPVPLILAFIGEVIMAYLLAGLIGHLGAGQVTPKNGVISAFFVWVGFIATTLTVNNAFQKKPFLLTLIDAGHWLAVLAVMGAIIGWWGV